MRPALTVTVPGAEVNADRDPVGDLQLELVCSGRGRPRRHERRGSRRGASSGPAEVTERTSSGWPTSHWQV